MMKRFSRRKRATGEGQQSAIDAAEWFPKIVEAGLAAVQSLEPWSDPDVPQSVAAIGRGERADGTRVIVSFSPRSATDAILGGVSAAQLGVDGSPFDGLLMIIAPEWPAGARRLLGLLGQTSYTVEPVAATTLASGRVSIEADSHSPILAVGANQLASRMASVDARAAFSRAALGLEGLAAKHGGAVRVGTDRLELVVLARRVAEIRLEGDGAVLETQIGGRSTTPLAGADLASALDGLEGQLRRRLNDRKVREGEDGLRGRVIASLASGTELRGLRPWPVPGSDVDVVDAVGVNAEGDPVVVAVRQELDWRALGAVLESMGPLGSLLPVLFADVAPPLRLGSPRLLFVAERFADGLERALAAMTLAYEFRQVAANAGASVDLVSSGAGEGAQSRGPKRGRRRGGRGRSRGGDEASSEQTPPSGPAADVEGEDEGSGRRPSRTRSRSDANSDGSAADADASESEDRDESGRSRSRRRRRPRRGRESGPDGPAAEGTERAGRESEAGRSSEGGGPRRPRFEEVSLMDLDDAPEPSGSGRSTAVDEGSAADDADSEGSGSRRRSSRRGRRGGRGDSRKRGGARADSGDKTDRAERADSEATGSSAAEPDVDAVAEEDLVDADDLSEILARLTDEEPDFESSDATEESFEDDEEIDEDEQQSARRRARDSRRRSKSDDDDDANRRAARGRAAILVHADRDSLFSAILLARDIRQLEGMWIYPQEELMTFFRSIATDLRDDTPIFLVGFTPSPARDVVQASALYRGRLTWFDRQAWPPEDLMALRESLGGDAVHGGEGVDSTLPLVLETCSRRSRFSDKLVDLATGRFTQHDFERWGRLWRWRASEIAAKTGDIRSDIAPLLAGRPSDLAKEAALVDLPAPPPEVAWVAENDFRLVHFGGHVMVVLDVDPALDAHLCARIARERYSATLSLAHRADEGSFTLGGDEISGKRTLDFLAVAEHLSNKLEWVDSRPDSDHVARFHVRDLDRFPERIEEIIGEIAMGRSLLER